MGGGAVIYKRMPFYQAHIDAVKEYCKILTVQELSLFQFRYA